MVEMKILDKVIREVSLNDIILCKDRKGNWLHKDWCRLSYYEKDRGCPRFYKDCMKIIKTIFDVGIEPFIIVGYKFDFKKYIDDMRNLHPDWSIRKLKTVIYYQNRIKNIVDQETKNVIYKYVVNGYSNLDFTDKPEIYGVFIIAMMLRMGYEIELKPENILWRINLIYKRKDKGGFHVVKDLREYFI